MSFYCVICDCSSLRREFTHESFSVFVCEACGHRLAEHAIDQRQSDYYESTPQQKNFIETLRVSRIRQSKLLLEKATQAGIRDEAWLDFGCGRGWFLEEARSIGRAHLAGFDTSELSTKWLTDKGFPMAKPLAGEFWPDWRSLPFTPEVISLLDVIEHFDEGEVLTTLERLKKELPSLRYLVIKVPCSEGALFQAALKIRMLLRGPYSQLFQVGTFPPHYHFFSLESITRLLNRVGLTILDSWCDYEVDNLFQRIPALSFLPGGEFAAKPFQYLPGDAYSAIVRVNR